MELMQKLGKYMKLEFVTECTIISITIFKRV
uniref:Uncharacterized protein n=1 Tax=Rhizophora mucronata TaxID=61149 RepID=A0A2P2QG08_RHIMU